MTDIWLNAHTDPVANLHSFQSCIVLSSVYGQTNTQCVIADNSDLSGAPKLKVYNGTSLNSEAGIVDCPTALVSFHLDTTEPRIPALAMAAGPFVYVYKNMRPYFKFTVPSMEINPIEQDLWSQAKEDKIDPEVLFDMLDNIKSDPDAIPLTPLSTKFIQTNPVQRKHFISLYKDTPLKRQTVITCLDTMNKSHNEDDAISCLVIGTESKEILVLDPEAFTMLLRLKVPSVPVFIRATGLYDVDFRLLVACRNGNIFVMKKGQETPKYQITVNSHPVGIERVGKSIYIGTMDNALICYSNKAKHLWELKFPSTITCMTFMDYKAKTFKGVLIALENKELRLYKDKFLINTTIVEDQVSMMRFGKYDREDSSLIVIGKTGCLSIYILKRNVDLSEGKENVSGPPPQQYQKLNVPRKTKTFVDQTLRERDNGTTMHRIFQHDLYRLRLNTAQNYVNALQKKMTPVSHSALAPLKLAANVQGIGPMFRLTVEIMNTSTNAPIIGAYVILVANESLYVLEKSYISMPLLVPSLTYAVNTMVRCTSEQGLADNIKVFVYVKGKCSPVLTATIDMPISETMIVV